MDFLVGVQVESQLFLKEKQKQATSIIDHKRKRSNIIQTKFSKRSQFSN